MDPLSADGGSGQEGPGSAGAFSAPKVIGWMVDEDLCQFCEGGFGRGWRVFVQMPDGRIADFWHCMQPYSYHWHGPR